MDRCLALVQGTTLPERTRGTALFADISGFTPLTEALAGDRVQQPGNLLPYLKLLGERVWSIALVTGLRNSIIIAILVDLKDLALQPLANQHIQRCPGQARH